MESIGENEIQSDSIGKLIMKGLQQLDTVAYVRFASVYKDFREASDFENFVSEIADHETK